MAGGAAGMAWLLATALEAALLLAASWAGALLLRRAPAAARHQIWALGVAGALLLPLLVWALRSLPLASPAPTAAAARALQATVVFVIGGRAAPGAVPAWPAWLAVLWAAGALGVSLRFARAHRAARRLARRAQPARSPAWLAARAQAAATLGLRGDVFLGRGDTVGSPMTIGLWRPRVLLPLAAEGWSPERLHAVLLHELGHVRRRDTLIQLAAQLACALYWWNPLTWLAAARLRALREHACDDLVLAAGIRPSSYAADLLELARALPGAAAGGGASMIDGAGAEARLRRILDGTVARRPPGAGFRLAARAAALALAGTVACTHAAKAADEAPRAPGGFWLGQASVDAWLPAALAEEPFDLAIANELRRHAADLERCYAERLRVRPGLSGMVAMRWTLAGGLVFDRGVDVDTLRDEEVVSCVKDVVRGLTFPPSPAGTVDIRFPFYFGSPPPAGPGC